MNVPIDVEAVRAKLIELGWTQAELAEAAKLSKRAVEGILSRGTAALESLHRIANALEMDVNAIRRVPSSTPSPPPEGGHEPLGEAGPKPPAAAEVFISYSSRDRDRVLEIANQLEGLGVSCWLDRAKIPGASNYGPEIVGGIKGCKVLLVCCSDASLRSKNVKQEIQLGWKYDRPYLPLLLERVSYPEQVEYWLEGWQWVEALDGSADRWLPTLIGALVNAGVESARAAYGQFGIASTVTPKARPGLAGLRALAKFTDQIWPIPAAKVVRQATRGRLRGLGAPQDDVERGHRLGSRVALAIETETSGHLLLLDEGPEQILYCLCPSHFAPDTTLPVGRSYLPQPGSRYDAFVVSGKPGREHLVAIISREPLVKDWLSADTRLPAKTLTEADVAQLLRTLQELPVTDWIALSTYFDVLA